MPEPWATRLVQEGGARSSSTRRTLWPKGQYVTTQLIVRTEFLKDHPDAVKRLLEGQVAANDHIKNDPSKAQDLVGQGIDNATGKPLPAERDLGFVQEPHVHERPDRTSLRKSAKDAEAAGLLKAVDLKGIYDLKPLNQVLKKQGEPTVKS